MEGWRDFDEIDMRAPDLQRGIACRAEEGSSSSNLNSSGSTLEKEGIEPNLWEVGVELTMISQFEADCFFSRT